MSPSSLISKTRIIHNQQGTYLVISAIILSVMFGLSALGIEAGRWYAIQGDLSKSIDGAAFAGSMIVVELVAGGLALAGARSLGDRA